MTIEPNGLYRPAAISQKLQAVQITPSFRLPHTRINRTVQSQ